MTDINQRIETLANLILQVKHIVIFTGAGISTESGISDYRGPTGMWKKYNPADFTIQKFLSSYETRRQRWQMLIEGGLALNARPNRAHKAIAELDGLGKLDCIITQNIDNLHQRAGVSKNKIFELHGNMKRVICLNCHQTFTIEEVMEKIKKGTEVPDCPDCHGLLKPDVVFFGEQLPQKTLEQAIHYSQICDLFIAIGSTLSVYPAAYMPLYAINSGAKLAIINLSPTELDSYATILIPGKAGEVMTTLLHIVRNKIS
ncbi:MAG: NAD-dependent deacylase [Chloroflexota bacterium]|nr:NAD-dependent deacylase [Chloroflexota bacterium]